MSAQAVGRCKRLNKCQSKQLPEEWRGGLLCGRAAPPLPQHCSESVSLPGVITPHANQISVKPGPGSPWGLTP